MEHVGQLKPSIAYRPSGTLPMEPGLGFRFETEAQPKTEPGHHAPSEAPVSIPELKSLIKGRRLRSEVIGEDLFADPAWDIMLDLYLASLMQHRISVSSLCVGVVPPTTTLRWLSVLSNRGMIERRNDPFDSRRVLLNLSEGGRRTMDAYFERVQLKR